MIARTGIAETQAPKFAGHETFCLRYGWPKKAVDAAAADPLVFTRDDALVRLGVGKNMVRSIRQARRLCTRDIPNLPPESFASIFLRLHANGGRD